MKKSKLQVIAPAENRANIIDEYGELCRRADEFKPAEARRKVLAEKIQGWYDSESAEQHYIAAGNKYNVNVSARQNERKVLSWPKVFAMLGKAHFLELATIALGLLDKWLTPDQLAEVIEQKQTGRRTLTPVLAAAVDEKRAA